MGGGSGSGSLGTPIAQQQTQPREFEFGTDPFKTTAFDSEKLSFTVDQGGSQFSFSTFESQREKASQFDPTKDFQLSNAASIVAGQDTALLRQGDLSFFVSRPTLGAGGSATDPASISPTGAAGQRLSRVGAGSFLGTAASRSLSRSATSRNASSGVRRPTLTGV